MPTTIRDIAQVLQVSHTTVSRVLNGRGAEFISEDTRQRVFQTARAMNYRPNRAARALANGRTNTVALWIGDPVYPYYGSVLHQVEMLLDRQEMDMVYVPIRHVARYMASKTPVDGILALDWGDTVETLLNDPQHLNLPPLVNMGHYVSEQIDTVVIDLAQGTREAVSYLLSTGRSRIVFVSSGRGQLEDVARRVAYREVMELAGRTPEYLDVDVLPDTDVRPEVRKRIVARFQQKNPLPDALFCFSDEILMGAYRGLRDVGRRIPEDVALIGCDGIHDLAYFDPPISTIAQPFMEMCEKAWELLQRRMANPDAPLVHLTLKPQLILRESAGPSSKGQSVTQETKINF